MNKKSRVLPFIVLSIVFVTLWGVCHLSSLMTVAEFLMGILTPIIAGCCIAFILNIPLRFLERLWIKWFSARYRGLRRFICILICIIAFSGVIALLIGIVIPQIWRTVEGIIGNVPYYIEKAKGWYSYLGGVLTRFSIKLPPIDLSADVIMEKLKNFAYDNSHHILGTSVDIATKFFSAVFDTVVALVLSLYILAQKEKLGGLGRKVLYSIFSEKTAERLLTFTRLSSKTFSGFVTGQLTEAIIIGILCFIGMLIFKMPYKALISVLVGVTALIPIFGAFIGTGIGAFLILFDSPIKAVMFVVFIIVLQQLEGNIIYPRVVGSQVGLPGLWVLVAVTIGAEFGVFGMLVSVPLVSLMYTVLRQFVDARIKEKGLEDKFPEDEQSGSPKKSKKKDSQRKSRKNKKKRGAEVEADNVTDADNAEAAEE